MNQNLKVKTITDGETTIARYALECVAGKVVLFVKIDNCYPGKTVGEMEDIVEKLVQETCPDTIGGMAYLNI